LIAKNPGNLPGFSLSKNFDRAENKIGRGGVYGATAAIFQLCPKGAAEKWKGVAVAEERFPRPPACQNFFDRLNPGNLPGFF